MKNHGLDPDPDSARSWTRLLIQQNVSFPWASADLREVKDGGVLHEHPLLLQLHEEFPTSQILHDQVHLKKRRISSETNLLKLTVIDSDAGHVREGTVLKYLNKPGNTPNPYYEPKKLCRNGFDPELLIQILVRDSDGNRFYYPCHVTK